MEDHPAEIHCLHGEMTTCRLEMMDMGRIVMMGTATLAEIMAAPEIQGIMPLLPETTPTEIMDTQAPVMTMAPEDMVIVTGTVAVIGITIIQVAVLTGITSLTVTHVVPRLQEGPLHHMAAAAMTIMAAGEMVTEAETVTQAAGMICTQVDATELDAKTEACPLQWIEAILPHAIHTAAQVAAPPVAVAEAGAGLIEEAAEADIKATILTWT